MRNFVLNENYYDTFPLAAIFGTPYIHPPEIGGIKYGRQGKNAIMNFLGKNFPDDNIIWTMTLSLFRHEIFPNLSKMGLPRENWPKIEVEKNDRQGKND